MQKKHQIEKKFNLPKKNLEITIQSALKKAKPFDLTNCKDSRLEAFSKVLSKLSKT